MPDFFDPVHQPVRHVQHLVNGRWHAPENGDADAAADRRPAAGEVSRQFFANPIEHDSRARSVGLGQEYSKLVASQTRHDIRVTRRPVERGGDRPQDEIPLGMARRVVERLEIVEIDVADRRRMVVSRGQEDQSSAALLEGSRVQEPGEAVDPGQHLLLSQRALQLREEERR